VGPELFFIFPLLVRLYELVAADHIFSQNSGKIYVIERTAPDASKKNENGQWVRIFVQGVAAEAEGNLFATAVQRCTAVCTAAALRYEFECTTVACCSEISSSSAVPAQAFPFDRGAPRTR
jgi:hypothetical protein